MAAHLAGAVAANTVKPVIGVPIDVSLDGLDALLSTVQMPGGIPVASVAIGKAGAKNAAYLAAQIISLADPELAQRLRADRAANADAVQAKNAALQEQLRD
jgi:5-(carboxyamino)imidazole ribonucleotide mutase